MLHNIDNAVDYVCFSSLVKSYGFLQFIPLSDLNNPLNGFILNDSLIVEGQIVLLSMVKSLVWKGIRAYLEIISRWHGYLYKSPFLSKNYIQ